MQHIVVSKIIEWRSSTNIPRQLLANKKSYSFHKLFLLSISCFLAILSTEFQANAEDHPLSENRQFTFLLAPGVTREQIRFKNRFGIELCADLYKLSATTTGKKYPAIVCGGPYGAVKEQSSGLYANELASHGFITLAFDPSYTGESGGEPRNMSSPDINTEDFSACVDYLSNRPDVDAEKIGILGICGLGGAALNAAQSDPRIKAIMHVSGTNMHWVQSQGMFNAANTQEARKIRRKADAEKRTRQFASQIRERDGGVPQEQPDDASQYNKEYTQYYKRPRGYHPNSPNSNGGMDATAWISWVNTPLMERIEEIDAPVLILAGENAHTRYMGEAAYNQLKGENKRLAIVPGAVHCDLYDGGPKHDKIPWYIVNGFFNQHLAKKQ